MARISKAGKRKQGRHIDFGYGPQSWTKIREFTQSCGTKVMIPDWKTPMMKHCFSEGESYLFDILNFNPSVKWVSTQVELEDNLVNNVASELGYDPVNDEIYSVTTDFLVKFNNDQELAISYKDNESAFDTSTKEGRKNEKTRRIEELYWKYRNTPFKVVYRTDINFTLVQNIRLVIQFNERSDVYDVYSLAKYLIANHRLNVNMVSEKLDLNKIVKGFDLEALFNEGNY